jgi:hypothetical protein
MKKVIKKVSALIGIGFSLLALLSVLFILVKGWGLRTVCNDETEIKTGERKIP